MISALQKPVFFDTTERNIRGNMIRPIDMTASVLFDQWKLNEEDDEFTIMKMIVIGMEGSESRTPSICCMMSATVQAAFHR